MKYFALLLAISSFGQTFAQISELNKASDKAQQIFDRISTQYPNSRLVDDALYQSGALELDKGNNQTAVFT